MRAWWLNGLQSASFPTPCPNVAMSTPLYTFELNLTHLPAFILLARRCLHVTKFGGHADWAWLRSNLHRLMYIDGQWFSKNIFRE